MGLGDGGWGGGGGGAEGEVLFVVMQCLLLLTGTDSYITHALSLLWAGRGGGGEEGEGECGGCRRVNYSNVVVLLESRWSTH